MPIYIDNGAVARFNRRPDSLMIHPSSLNQSKSSLDFPGIFLTSSREHPMIRTIVQGRKSFVGQPAKCLVDSGTASFTWTSIAASVARMQSLHLAGHARRRLG